MSTIKENWRMELKYLFKNIRKYRKVANYTTTELAELTKTSQSTISKIENSQKIPNIRLLVRIANALAVSLDDLVGRTGSFDNAKNMIIDDIIDQIETLRG